MWLPGTTEGAANVRETENPMPDFGQLSDLFGGITDILSAVVAFTGSLGGGEGGVNAFVEAVSSISADAAPE